MGQAVRALREFFAIRSLATRMNPLRYGCDRNPWPHVIGAMVSLALSTAALGADGWTPLTDGWTRYTNERFGTIVEFPLHLFKPTTPPENGDGRALDAGDGARIFVFASYGPSTVTEDFSGYKAWLLSESGLERISYKAEGANWLAFSGREGPDIVYVKVVEGCGAAHEVHIRYPSAMKTHYDAIVGRISRSLTCLGRGRS